MVVRHFASSGSLPPRRALKLFKVHPLIKDPSLNQHEINVSKPAFLKIIF